MRVFARMIHGMVLCLVALWAIAALADGPFILSPLNPQPDKASLNPGLAVEYAYGEAKWLEEAEGWRGNTKPGPPLEGFVYGDSTVGEKILTADSSEYVVAFIKGLMHFKEGTHELEFQSNDGLRVMLSGQKVHEHDGRHKCEPKGITIIIVPKTGWYAVEAVFFNRKFTACLDLSIRPSGGEWDFTNPEMYAHVAK